MVDALPSMPDMLVPTTDLPDGDPKKELVFIDDDIIRLQAQVERLKSRHGLENILGLAQALHYQCTSQAFTRE